MSKGYQHRAAIEFVFGEDSVKVVTDALDTIYKTNPQLAVPSRGRGTKAATIRAELLEAMGYPLADTDRDLGGRITRWGKAWLDKEENRRRLFAQSPSTKKPLAQPEISKDHLFKIPFVDVFYKTIKSHHSDGSYLQCIWRIRRNATAVIATGGTDGFVAEDGYCVEHCGRRALNFYKRI